jgi:hypothetical protein
LHWRNFIAQIAFEIQNQAEKIVGISLDVMYSRGNKILNIVHVIRKRLCDLCIMKVEPMTTF